MKKSFDFSSAKANYFDLSDKNPFVPGFGWYKAGTSYQYDMHYGLEFGMILNGEMRIAFPDFKIDLSPGNVWFCGMWEPHGWAVGSSSCEQINIIIWPPALACLRFNEAEQFNWLAPFTAPPARRPQTNKTTRPAMLAIGAGIMNCLKNREDQKNLWLRMFIMEAILLATSRWTEEKTSSPAQAGSGEQLNLVLRRFFDDRGLMTTEKAAGICGLNRNAFSQMFRRLMGLPFADFTLRYRLSSAASRLRQSGESVKSIALLWGFADTSHFDRLFAGYYGCTPGEYREKKSGMKKSRM